MPNNPEFMSIKEYKESNPPFRDGAACYLTRNTEQGLAILLGERKNKEAPGCGTVAGIGGGYNPLEDSDFEDTARREIFEEAKVSLSSLRQTGTLHYMFPQLDSMAEGVRTNSLNQAVRIFISDSFTGEPQETPDTRPIWVDFSMLEILHQTLTAVDNRYDYGIDNLRELYNLLDSDLYTTESGNKIIIWPSELDYLMQIINGKELDAEFLYSIDENGKMKLMNDPWNNITAIDNV